MVDLKAPEDTRWRVCRIAVLSFVLIALLAPLKHDYIYVCNHVLLVSMIYSQG